MDEKHLLSITKQFTLVVNCQDMNYYKFHRTINCYTLILIMTCIVGCKPSINDCKECLELKFDNKIRVTNTHKKNGIKINRNGLELYEIYFSCNIQFIEDCKIGTPAYTLSEFRKGDRFEIGSAQAEFIKTDNGWKCSGADYDIIDGFYYINKDGQRLNFSEYAKLKGKQAEQVSRVFTGRIDDIMPYAALSLRRNENLLSALLYDKESKRTLNLKGYITGEKWVLKLSENSWLEGIRDLYNGKAYYEREYIGDFSFREVSFDWEKVKKYDTPSKELKPTYYMILSDTAYAYNDFINPVMQNTYLLAGNMFTSTQYKGDYIYIEEVVEGDTTVKGWINASDIAFD